MKKCSVSAKCGGCRLLAVPYSDQLKMKRTAVREMFPGADVQPVCGMKDPYHYRHKIYCAFGYDRFHHIRAGLFEENSHRIVFTKECLIQHTAANRLIGDLCRYAEQLKIEPYDEDTTAGHLRYAYIRVSHHSGKLMLTLVIGSKFLPNEKALIRMIREEHPEVVTLVLNYNRGHDSMVLGQKERVLFGKGRLLDKIDGVTFSISPRSFYQVNPVQTEILYRTALDLAGIRKTDNVLDLCCGIGTISLLAAKRAAFVLGVEINPQAIQDAKLNARLNGIENTEFVAMDAEAFMERLGEKPDVIFLDPPRAGLSEKTLDAIGNLGTKTIVYVSCNPETQARDTKYLRSFGYRIRTIVPVDQFPFTSHIETVALLSLQPSKKHGRN